ncbi:MAG: DNA/RNA nuclease SfsA [Alkalispirochaetaceae bacterium]
MSLRVQLFRGGLEARLVARPNRFVILCELPSGQRLRAHCPNPGRMLELLLPGCELILEEKEGSDRKTPATVVALRRPSDSRVVPLVSVAANLLARELVLPELFGPRATVIPEVARGASRFDFLVETPLGRTWVEVKSCTLEAHGVAMFPDAATLRGRRHLEELAAIKDGGRMVLFVIQGLEAKRFVPDIHADPGFALALKAASEAGVAVRAATVGVSERGEAWLESAEVPVDLAPVALAEADAGVYMVVLELDSERNISVAGLGIHSFSPGYYIYVGSGKKNLSARVARHLGRRKRMHWHFDYLRAEGGKARGYPIYTDCDLECDLASDLGTIYTAPVARFGSSDCSCRSHLFYTDADPRSDPAFVAILLRYRHQRSLSGC